MTQELLGRVHRELLDVLNSINQDKIHHDGDDFHELLNDVEKALAQPEQCNYPDCKCPTENPCLKGLAQPEQEPVAIKRMKEWIEYLKRKSDFGQHMKIPSEMSAGTCWELAIELEQFINTTPPQQEPVIDKSAAIRIATSLGWTPQRKPLTDEEIINKCLESGFERNCLGWSFTYGKLDYHLLKLARAIEAAHGIKENT